VGGADPRLRYDESRSGITPKLFRVSQKLWRFGRALTAATALVHGLTIVTRHVPDFRGSVQTVIVSRLRTSH
jgi:predicted nucleic acid-binding protein